MKTKYRVRLKMPEVTAMIHVDRNEDGGLSYKWEGPVDAFVPVTSELLDSCPALFRDSPWDMVNVDRVHLYAGPPEGGIVHLFKRREFA